MADILYNGTVDLIGVKIYHTDGCVRPALIVSNLKSFNLSLYSEVELDNGTIWRVISDNMLLCNDIIFESHRFDNESNDYEKSEIKQYIYEVAENLGFNFGTSNIQHKNKKKLVVLDENK